MNGINFNPSSYNKKLTFTSIRLPIKQTPEKTIEYFKESGRYALGRTTATEKGRLYHIFTTRQGTKEENTLYWRIKAECPYSNPTRYGDIPAQKLISNQKKFEQKTK